MYVDRSLTNYTILIKEEVRENNLIFLLDKPD
jgi:hypothetical protein